MMESDADALYNDGDLILPPIEDDGGLSFRIRHLFESQPWTKWALGLTTILVLMVLTSVVSIAGAYSYWNQNGGGIVPGPGPCPTPEPGPDFPDIPGMNTHKLPHGADKMPAISLLQEMFFHPPYRTCQYVPGQIYRVNLTLLIDEEHHNKTFGPVYSKGKSSARKMVAQLACTYFFKFTYNSTDDHIINDPPAGPCVDVPS